MKVSNEIIISKENKKVFLVNKRTGDLYEIDKKIESFLEKIKNGGTAKNIDQKVLIGLERTGIIINQTKTGDNLHLQWHLTERCNLKCAHCYQEDTISNDLSLLEMKKFIDHFVYVLKKQHMNGSISLTGGEPLILGNKFWDLVRYIKLADVPIKIYVLSNGTLITQDIADKFVENKIGCQISFDGPNADIHDIIRGKGNFLRALKGANLLITKKVPVSSHFVIMKQNVKYVKDIIDFCIKNEFEMLTFSRLVLMGRGKKVNNQILSPLEVKKTYEEIASLAEKYKNKLEINTNRTLWCNIDKNKGGTCPAGFSTLVINANGSVYPCRRLPIKIGNITENSIFEIWYGSEVMKKLRDRKKIIICGDCKFLDKCGGCRAIAYSYFGNYMFPDPQCWRIYKKLPKV